MPIGIETGPSLLQLLAEVAVRRATSSPSEALDKLEDDGKPSEASPLDRVLGTLKNLFTASGLTFIFVAGKALHERWLEDLSRGNSVFESVFAHAQYLSGMWTDSDSLCNSLAGATNGRRAEETVAYAAFKKYLAFKGRGIPRRTIRGFNEFVKWDAATPHLEFSHADVRRFRFYAGLLDALVNAEEELLGQYRGEGSVEQLDRRRARTLLRHRLDHSTPATGLHPGGSRRRVSANEPPDYSRGRSRAQ